MLPRRSLDPRLSLAYYILCVRYFGGLFLMYSTVTMFRWRRRSCVVILGRTGYIQPY